MDAKSKANFINSVAGGQNIPCPNCNTLNEADSLFCFSCGAKLRDPGNVNESQSAQVQTAAFEQVSMPPVQSVEQPIKRAPIFQMAVPAIFEEPEEISVFAQGLPDWDIVPPQVMVRRKKK